MPSKIAGATREVMDKAFGSYIALLKMPHGARYSVAAVFASMQGPMLGMALPIGIQRSYDSYALAGLVTGVQSVAMAVVSPLVGKLVDRYGQHKIAIPAVVIWLFSASALILAITVRAPQWCLFLIAPFLSINVPFAAMSRARWVHRLNGDSNGINAALGLSSVLDECMWIIGNPLASIFAVISPVLAFVVAEVFVALGAVMFITERTTEPPSQKELARRSGMDVGEYLRQEAVKKDVNDGTRPGSSPSKTGIWNLGFVAICVTWLGLGIVQNATNLSIIAFAKEQGMESLTGFVFACFSASSLIGALIYGQKSWGSALWKRFYFCFSVVVLGFCSFIFIENIWGIALVYLLVGVCQAPTWQNGNQLILDVVSKSRFTEGLAWMNALFTIGNSLGSAVAGIFIDESGSAGGFAAVTVSGIFALVLAFSGFKQIKAATSLSA